MPSERVSYASRSEALRRALQVTLSAAPSDATPEQVLADAFARLGYLPDEAKQAGLKILAKAEDKASEGF